MGDPIHGVRKTEGEPHDSLTRRADAMLAALAVEFGDDVKCIAFVNDGERGGIGTHGYADQRDAITDLLMHLKAMFNAMGVEMGFTTMHGNPEEN